MTRGHLFRLWRPHLPPLSLSLGDSSLSYIAYLTLSFLICKCGTHSYLTSLFLGLNNMLLFMYLAHETQ